MAEHCVKSWTPLGWCTVVAGVYLLLENTAPHCTHRLIASFQLFSAAFELWIIMLSNKPALAWLQHSLLWSSTQRVTKDHLTRMGYRSHCPAPCHGLISEIRVGTVERLSSALWQSLICPQESGTLTFQTINALNTVSLVWAVRACLPCSLCICTIFATKSMFIILYLTWEFAHTYAFAELASKSHRSE